MAELGPEHRWAEKSQKIKRPREQLVLNITHLVQILHLLVNYQYAGTDYYKLGLYLGLLPRTLDVIATNHTGDVSSCLEECLKAWLKQVDYVKNTYGPTYYSLIKALRNINQIAVADGIHREKHPACAIFACHCESDQSMARYMDSLPQLAILLHKEKIIVEQIVPKEVSALVMEVKDAICADYCNLEKFIFILMKLNNKSVTSIADSMLKEYKNVFTNNEFIMIPTERDVKVNLPLEINEEFTRIRSKFGNLLDDVAKAMDDTVDFESLKKYVSRSNKHLRSGLALCQSTDEVIELIGDHCSLIDVGLLVEIVDRYKVDKAKAAIQIYKDEIEKFYKEIPLHRCLNEQLASFSPLHCETAYITVDQNTEDYKLKDIQILMTAVFQRLATHIQVIFIIKANSFSIICSFSLTLSESLIATALENIEVLIERNVQKLVIGYCILYDRDQTIKECEGKDVKQYITSSEFYSSVYTSKSTIEQLLVSQSIQVLSLRNEVLDSKTEMEHFSNKLEERMQQVEHFKKKAEEKTQEAEKHMESIESLHTLKKKLCYENDKLKANVDTLIAQNGALEKQVSITEETNQKLKLQVEQLMELDASQTQEAHFRESLRAFEFHQNTPGSKSQLKDEELLLEELRLLKISHFELKEDYETKVFDNLGLSSEIEEHKKVEQNLMTQIEKLQEQRVEERRKGESLMQNVIERRADLPDPAFVEDIFKQAEEDKKQMQRKIQDLEWRLEDEQRRRGVRDYGSGEQLPKQIESFNTGQMSQGLSSVDAMLLENMKRMERDREYLQRQLDNAEKEADDLRKKAEQNKKNDSKIQEMIRKEKNFKMESERLEREIDDLKFRNKRLEEQLKQEESKIIVTERDFDKMIPKRKKGVSFPISNDGPQSILKKGSYTDERERIDDESIPASTPTYEDLMKMKEEMAKLQSDLISLEKGEKKKIRE